jgi:hypothetical protein
MTHVYFDSDQIDWGPYLKQQQVGQGQMMGGRNDAIESEMPTPVFRGTKYMRGYGVKGAISSIGRFLLPIANNLLNSAKDEASLTLGRIGADMARGKPITETVKEHAQAAAQNFGTRLQQCGKGKKKATKKRLLKGFATENIEGADISEPMTSGPNPIPSARGRGRGRKRDYLDL